MPDIFNRTDLIGKNIYFLLDLEYAGCVFRLSSTHHDIERDDGTTIQYNPGLSEIRYDEEIDLFNLSPNLISVPMQITIPSTDIAELISEGYDLSAASGVLSIWIDGTTYENRKILLSGNINEPVFGSLAEPISFSLEQNPFEDRSLIVDPKSNVNQNTWAVIGSDENINVSNIYPLIFGKPSDASGEGSYTTPALLVDVISADTPDTLTLIVAGHRILNGSVSVALLDDSGTVLSTSPTFNPTTVTETDDDGRIVTTVGLSYNMLSLSGRKFYCRWDATAYGISNVKSSAMRGAGDIIEHLLSRSTINVDFKRLKSANQILNSYKLDFYVDEGVSNWDFIKSNILPILPVSVDVGPEGLYLVPWNFEPHDNDFVSDINIQTIKAERVGFVEYQNPKILANDITLEYSQKIPSKRYMLSSNAHGDVDKVAGTINGSFLNKACKLSHNRFGSQKKVIQTNIVYDQETASSITTWMSYAYSLKTKTISYEFDYSWSWLKPGDLIRLTDSSLFLSDIKCFIESVSMSDSATILVKFKIFDSMNTK